MRRGAHFGGRFGVGGRPGLAFGPGALFGGSSLSTPVTIRQDGITDPYILAGPLGHEPSFLTPDGYELMPSGPGVIRFVDTDIPVSGDGSTWETAFKTAQEAFDVHGEGDLILARTERSAAEELITLPDHEQSKGTVANPVRFAKSGTGIFRVRGTKKPASEGAWQVCTTSAEALGNPDFADIHRAEVTVGTDFNGETLELHDAVLLEGDFVASMSMLGQHYGNDTELMRIPSDGRNYWNADITGSDIAGMTKSGTTGAITAQAAHWQTYPQGTLDGCRVLINGSANKYIDVPLTSHNAATGELVFTNAVPPNNAWTTNQIALRNLPAYINAPGQWAARDIGGGKWRIWYWPNDPANLPDVGVSVRHGMLDLNDASNFILFGIQFAGAGGKFPQDGRNGTAIFSRRHNLNNRSNVVIEECHVFGNNVGGINVQRINNVRVLNNTAEKTLIGRAADFTNCVGAVVKGNDFNTTGLTAVSLYGLRQSIVVRNSIRLVFSIHGNGASIYLGADDCWIHSNRFDTKYAIGNPLQDCGNIYWTCNLGHLGPGVAARMYEQNSDLPAGLDRFDPDYSQILIQYPTPALFTIACNTTLFWPGADYSENTTAFKINNITHAINRFYGNLIAGNAEDAKGTHTDPGTSTVYTAQLLPPKFNVFMGTAGSGHEFLSLGEGNVQIDDPALVLTDPIGGPGVVPLGLGDGSCGDITDGLPIGQAWLLALPFKELLDRDFDGQPIDWTNAPIGAVKGPSVDNPVAPSNIVSDPTPLTVDEQATVGTEIGTLSATGSRPITFSEVLDPDNKFEVAGDRIRATAALDFDTAQSHQFRVRATNAAGNTERLFAINVIENNILPPTAAVAAARLVFWYDGRNGVLHTSGAVTAWADQVGGPSLIKGTTSPIYMANGYIRFLNNITDEMQGDTPLDFSQSANMDFFFRSRVHGTENFMLASDRGNGTPFIGIGEDGVSSDMNAGLGSPTSYIGGQVRTTRAQLYSDMVGNGFQSLRFANCDTSLITDFGFSGYQSSTFNGPVDHAQIVGTTADITAQEIADVTAFLDSLNYA